MHNQIAVVIHVFMIVCSVHLVLCPEAGILQVDVVRKGPSTATIRVTWSGIQCAGTCSHGIADISDRIALMYQPPQGKPKADRKWPIKYMFAHQAAPNSWAGGSGTVSFVIPNLRYPIYAAYLRKSLAPSLTASIWNNYTELATAVLQPWAPNAPSLGRLSITGSSAGSLAVTWHTRDAIPGAAVQWGRRLHQLTNTAQATWDKSYDASAMCNNPAKNQGWNEGADTINFAVMTGLTPSSVYYYRYGSEAAGWSKVMRFFTPPAASSNSSALRVLLAADMGHWSLDKSYEASLTFPVEDTVPAWAGVPGAGSIAYTIVQSLLVLTGGTSHLAQPGSKPVGAALEAKMRQAAASGQPYHGLLVAGDISYARGQSSQWATYLSQMESVLSSVPGMFAAGNHDVGGVAGVAEAAGFATVDGGGECGVAYKALLRMPQPSGPEFYWYSYDMGPVHFVVLSSEQKITRGSLQYRWLEKDLESVNRRATPWVVVVTHRPLYPDTILKSDASVAALLQQELEPLLVKHQVDVVLNGHLHEYYPTSPVMKNTFVGFGLDMVAKGPVHIVMGNGGYPYAPNMQSMPPALLAAQYLEYGFSAMTATKQKLIIQAFNTQGDEVDVLKLNKPLGWTPSPKDALATYTKTSTTPASPSTLDITASISQLATPLMTYLAGFYLSGGLEKNAFLNQTFGVGSVPYKLTNARPGEVLWTPTDMWSVVYPLVQWLKQLYGETWMKPAIPDVEYLLSVLQPGGRLYFGP